jgi:uncharacterized membrane protein YkvA (DUF1232 family)
MAAKKATAKTRRQRVAEAIKSKLRLIKPGEEKKELGPEVESKLKKLKKGSNLFKGIKDLWNTLDDHNIKGWKKGACLTAIIYFLIPGDLIPDLIPWVGWLDDATVVATVLAIVSKDNSCDEVSPEKLLERAEEIKAEALGGVVAETPVELIEEECEEAPWPLAPPPGLIRSRILRDSKR